MTMRPARLESLIRRAYLTWPSYYAILQQELGSTATLLDFGNQRSAGKVDAATWTGRRVNASGLAPTWTPSEPLSDFDTPFDLSLESNWLGVAPILTFNGTNEEADTPDADYWTRIDGAPNNEKLSIGVWVNPASYAVGNMILTKWTTTGSNREWELQYTTSGAIQFVARDESASVQVNRLTDTSTNAVNTWAFIVVTYDGTGGATAMDGVTIYVNGASVASTATNNASYVAMENLTSVVMVGGISGAAQYNGKMLGGPWSPFFVQVALTAAQIANLYANMRLGLGL